MGALLRSKSSPNREGFFLGCGRFEGGRSSRRRTSLNAGSAGSRLTLGWCLGGGSGGGGVGGAACFFRMFSGRAPSCFQSAPPPDAMDGGAGVLRFGALDANEGGTNAVGSFDAPDEDDAAGCGGLAARTDTVAGRRGVFAGACNAAVRSRSSRFFRVASTASNASRSAAGAGTEPSAPIAF